MTVLVNFDMELTVGWFQHSFEKKIENFIFGSKLLIGYPGVGKSENFAFKMQFGMITTSLKYAIFASYEVKIGSKWGCATIGKCEVKNVLSGSWSLLAS